MTHKTIRNYKKTGARDQKRPLVLIALVATVLSGCILQPDSGGTGSVTLRFSSLNTAVRSSDISAAEQPITAIGVFLYGPDGRERRSARVDVTGNSATIQLEDVPEGRGYTIVAVKYVNSDSSSPVRLPVARGESAPFAISGGRETRVSLATAAITEPLADRYPSAFRGKSLVGAGAFGGGEIVGATRTEVVVSSGNSALADISLPGDIQINGIFEGKVFGDANNNVPASVPLLATNKGILPAVPNSQYIAAASLAAGAEDVQEIIAFVAAGTSPNGNSGSEIVWVYSRLGGFGGITFSNNDELTPSASDGNSEWFDAGEDLDDVFTAGENPVRAMGTDGIGVAYLATRPLGTFRITEKFENVFDDDEDGDDIISDIIAGISQEGFTFFGVEPPGRSEAIRINRLGVVAPPSNSSDESNRVIVGSSQGAFWFNGSTIDTLAQDGGNVRGDAVQVIPQLVGQRVLDIAVADQYVALVTERRLLVLERAGSGFDEVINEPARGVVLGNFSRAFVGRTTQNNLIVDAVFISGTEGLTVVPIAIVPAEER